MLSLPPRTAVSRGLVLLALLAGSTAGEQAGLDVADLAAMDIEALMNIKVVSAAKKEQTVSETAAAIYVITAEDLRRSGVTSLPEALRMVPGVQAARLDANKWAISSRGFNSRFANKLLVMIDGRTVYTPMFSGVYWDVQDLLLEDVERIEVVRGPGATLWGANAVNGVINIITKSAHATTGSLVTGGGGTEEHGFGAVRHGGALGEDAAYRVYFKAFNRDASEFSSGDDAADDGRQVRGGFRVDWNAGERDAFVLQGDAYDGTVGSTIEWPAVLPPFSTTTDEDTEVAGGNLLTRWTHAVSDTSDLQAQLYFDRTERDSPFIREERDTVDADIQHRFALSPRQEVIYGLGYRYSADDTAAVSPTFTVVPRRRSDHLVSGFVQDEFTVVEDVLRLVAGSKFEHNDYTGFEVQPGARFAWTPDRRQTVWGAVSRAVRTPSRAEDDFTIDRGALPPGALGPDAPPALTRLVGNSDFDSEKLLAYELGYRVVPGERLSFDAAAFFNVYDDLRTFERGEPFPEADPTPTHLVVPLRGDNRMDGHTYGVELVADWRVREGWCLEAAYTYLELELDRDTGSTDATSEGAEGRSPRHQVSLRSMMDLPGRFELDGWFRYVDELSDLDVDSYATVDLHLGWRPSEDVEVAVVGRNLVESRHREFGPLILGGVPTEVERGVYGKITIRL